MNLKDEAVLRELNLYPLWVRRAQPHPAEVVHLASTAEQETEKSDVIDIKTSVGQSSITRIAQEPKKPEAKLAQNNLVESDWPQLKQQVADCTACKLRQGCSQTVFGVGDEAAEWLFVGEGPGAEEDEIGEPFVGQAGKLLDNMLSAIKLKRGNNVYIANVIKCCPPSSRSPEADEISQCLPYLHRQIDLIKPKLIVALGKTAATALLGREATLGSLRGTVHDYRGIPLIITFHPAYLLRSPAEKAKAWQDLCFAASRFSTL